MKSGSIVLSFLLLFYRTETRISRADHANRRLRSESAPARDGWGPRSRAQGLGISTLVLAGPEKLLFDCGRGMTTGMAALAINPADVTKVFLTHLHSDHIISSQNSICFPGLAGRNKPLQVWGLMAPDR